MQLLSFRAWKLAGLFLSAAIFISAQDWKTASDLPGIDLGGLSNPQKATVLKILREDDCGCECGRKIAQCRVEDPSCTYSQGLAAVIVDAIRRGKTEREALEAANASQYAHLAPEKLLSDPVQIPVAGAPSLGPANAPITLVEFSDFQCPYCAAAVPQIHAILQAYPAGVRLFFKQFPLDFHPRAALAAEASIAAQKQGKFWPMHDAMYAHPDRLSRADLMALAARLGMDVKKFESDLDSTEVRETVIRDIQDGDRAGVEGTPTLFINGQRYNGPLEASVLEPVLNAELKSGHAAKPATGQP
jgi:protein-disulfide isomerase